jgi:hypothetical protein
MIAIFDDASEVEFAGMLTNYRDSVTELTDLWANIQ